LKWISKSPTSLTLREAANDLGWKVSVKDNFDKGYKLGSVHEVRKYVCTDFNLRGTFLPSMQVTLYGKESTNHFSVYTGLPGGVALQHEVKRYLSAVSGHLE